MARPLPQIIAHIRAVVANPAISTTLIQTEDLSALCDAVESGQASLETMAREVLEKNQEIARLQRQAEQ